MKDVIICMNYAAILASASGKFLDAFSSSSSSAGDIGRRANFNLLETDGKSIMYSKS